MQREMSSGEFIKSKTRLFSLDHFRIYFKFCDITLSFLNTMDHHQPAFYCPCLFMLFNINIKKFVSNITYHKKQWKAVLSVCRIDHTAALFRSDVLLHLLCMNWENYISPPALSSEQINGIQQVSMRGQSPTEPFNYLSCPTHINRCLFLCFNFNEVSPSLFLRSRLLIWY